MENTNVNQSSGKTCAARFCGGVILLAVGILIGFLVTKYASHSPAVAQAGNAGNADDTAAVPASAMTNEPSQSGAWNPVDRMRDMQAEIDRVFQRSFADFQINPKLNVFQEEPGYSLSMDVRDMKNQYQVCAFLPDTKASNVTVNLQGNLLKVDVTNHSTQKQVAKNGQTTTREWGQYEEVVPLAGTLKADQMKIQRKAHELIITVPKV